MLDPGRLAARDINLDEIYIKKTSDRLARLIYSKLDTYRAVNAIFVSRNVIFAEWTSGSEILYIRENRSTNSNVLYHYNCNSRKSRPLTTIEGVITAFRTGRNGRFVVIKRLVLKNSIIPSGETLVYLPGKNLFERIESFYGFLDFTVTPEGISLLYEMRKGLMEYNPVEGNKTLIVPKSFYRDILISSNPSMAFFSPRRRSLMVINGGGGNYSTKIKTGNRVLSFKGITSSGEIAWIDFSRFIYRGGYSGNYSVVLYDIRRAKRLKLAVNSLNTNIRLSRSSGKVTFLQDQILQVYDLKSRKLFNTGIEGEDCEFSPLGRQFTTLLFKRLFIVNYHTVRRNRIRLKRSWKEILKNYTLIKKDRTIWENEYSLPYLNKKIRAYSGLLDKI